MTTAIHEHLLLNPDEQRPLYRSMGGMPYTKQDSLFTQGEQLRAKFPDYQDREREYQEWLNNKQQNND